MLLMDHHILIMLLFHFLMLQFDFVINIFKTPDIPHKGLPDTYDFDWVTMDLVSN